LSILIEDANRSDPPEVLTGHESALDEDCVTDALDVAPPEADEDIERFVSDR